MMVKQEPLGGKGGRGVTVNISFVHGLGASAPNFNLSYNAWK